LGFGHSTLAQEDYVRDKTEKIAAGRPRGERLDGAHAGCSADGRTRADAARGAAAALMASATRPAYAPHQTEPRRHAVGCCG
jgi:hypothetical protein